MPNIYIVAGQSNAVAMTAALQAELQALDPGAIVIAVSSAGAPLTWGRQGTDWYQRDDLATMLVTEVSRAMQTNPGATLESMIWVQGEADTYAFARSATYQNQFLALLSAIDTGLREAVPGVAQSSLNFGAVISQLSSMAPAAPARTNWGTIIDQQRLLDAGSDRITGVDPDLVGRSGGYSGPAMFRDGLHYSEEFIDRLAAVLAAQAVAGAGPVAPRGLIIEGTDAAERLTGRETNDLIQAGNGADTIFGGAGNDRVSGGWGGDLIYGGVGQDRLWGVNGNDTITGEAGNDSIYGGEGIDFLFGGTGGDILNGGLGADMLSGGSGSDTLTGGEGADAFVFNTAPPSGSFDTITDYNVIADVIRLDDAAFGPLPTRALAASAFVASLTGAASDGLDRILYETDTGRLYFDADGSGSRHRIHFATLSANLELTSADFFVF